MEGSFGWFTKAEGYCFDGGCLVLFGGFAECEWFLFERFQADLPPGCGIAFR
jgi:hypothetical protein